MCATPGLRFVATYLFRVEKEIQGLAEGPWITRKGKRDWVERVKNTKVLVPSLVWVEVSSFGCQVSGSGFMVQVVGFRVSGSLSLYLQALC